MSEYDNQRSTIGLRDDATEAFGGKQKEGVFEMAGCAGLTRGSAERNFASHGLTRPDPTLEL